MVKGHHALQKGCSALLSCQAYLSEETCIPLRLRRPQSTNRVLKAGDMTYYLFL